MDDEGRPERRPLTDADQRRATLARERATARRRERDRRRKICREAERLMPLSRYYGPQPLLAVPLGHIYVRGRWAA